MMKIQKPFKGRAKITISDNQGKIKIPVKRMWFLIIVFFAVGIVFWGAFLVLLKDYPGKLTEFFNMPQNELLQLGILLAVNLGLLATLLWLVFRKEIITFDKTQLKIKKQFAFYRTRKYTIEEISDFKVKESLNYRKIIGFGYGNNRYKWLWTIEVGEVFSFFYRNEKIKFGKGIDEAEGKHILHQLVEKGLLPRQ